MEKNGTKEDRDRAPETTEDLEQEYRKLREELHRTRLEQARDRSDLEHAIERANALALETELSSIELNQIINTSVDGMVLIEKDFSIRRINNALLSLLELRPEDALGKQCRDVLSDHRCGTDQCPLMSIMAGRNRIETDVEKTLNNGSTVSFMFTATPFRGIDGALIGMVGRFMDITERKQAEEALRLAKEQLEEMATVDSLTRVANRRFFEQVLEGEWRRLQRTEEPLALVLCSLDHFSDYNSAHGVRQGDECLRATAALLSSLVKRGGDRIARTGDDTFAAILPATEEEGAVHMAELFRRSVELQAMEHRSSPTAPHVTLSLGVAVIVPTFDGKPIALFRAAEEALSLAKATGRNRTCRWHKRKGAISLDERPD